MVEKFSPGLRKVLEEMCSRVNVDISKINFSDPLWFESHCWTQEEQENFMNWLEKKILEDKEVRNALVGTYASKRMAKQVAGAFILSYGWTTNPERVKEFQKRKIQV